MCTYLWGEPGQMPKADRAPTASGRQELGAEDLPLIWSPASHRLPGSLARDSRVERCPCHELGSSSSFKRRGRVWAVLSCLFQKVSGGRQEAREEEDMAGSVDLTDLLVGSPPSDKMLPEI